MPGPTPHYPPEFNREATQLYHSSDNKSIPKMAKELAIASESLRRSIKHHQIDAGERAKVSPPTSSARSSGRSAGRTGSSSRRRGIS